MDYPDQFKIKISYPRNIQYFDPRYLEYVLVKAILATYRDQPFPSVPSGSCNVMSKLLVKFLPKLTRGLLSSIPLTTIQVPRLGQHQHLKYI